jgi:hypothetical protein
LRYRGLSDEAVTVEIEKRLKEMKRLLLEIRDALRSAGGLE